MTKQPKGTGRSKFDGTVLSRRSVLLGGATMLAAACSFPTSSFAAMPGTNPGKYKVDLGGYTGPELTSETITLRIMRQEFSPEINAAIQGAYDQFMAAYPNITIEEERVPYGDLPKKVQIYIASDTAPDIMMGKTDFASAYAAAQIAVPMQEFLSQDFIADLSAPLRESATINGDLLCLPWEANSTFLYFNREIFKRAGVETPPEVSDVSEGWTVEQYLDAMRALTEKIRGEGDQATFGLAASRYGNRGPGSNYTQLESMWVRMMGDPSAAKDTSLYKTFAGVSEDGLTATGYLDTAEAIAGITNYQMLFTEGLTPKGIVADMYKGGIAATDFGGMNFANQFRASGAPFDWGATPLPRGTIPYSTTVADAPFVYAGSKHIPEAAALLAFILNDANRRSFHQARGTMPSRMSLVGEDPQYQTDQVNKLALNVANTAFGPPKSVGWFDYLNAVNPAVKDIALGADPATRLHRAATQIDKLMVKYR